MKSPPPKLVFSLFLYNYMVDRDEKGFIWPLFESLRFGYFLLHSLGFLFQRRPNSPNIISRAPRGVEIKIGLRLKRWSLSGSNSLLCFWFDWIWIWSFFLFWAPRHIGIELAPPGLQLCELSVWRIHSPLAGTFFFLGENPISFNIFHFIAFLIFCCCLWFTRDGKKFSSSTEISPALAREMWSHFIDWWLCALLLVTGRTLKNRSSL